MATNYYYLTETATASKPSWSNRDTFLFEYFNPNGAVAKWNDVCDQVSQLVDEELVPSSWLFVYGSLNDYHYKSLSKLTNKKRIPSFDLSYSVNELKKITEKSIEAMKTITKGEG